MINKYLILAGLFGIFFLGILVDRVYVRQHPVIETRTELQCSAKGDAKLVITYDPVRHTVVCGTTYVVE
jgi:hypothetical protein